MEYMELEFGWLGDPINANIPRYNLMIENVKND